MLKKHAYNASLAPELPANEAVSRAEEDTPQLDPSGLRASSPALSEIVAGKEGINQLSLGPVALRAAVLREDEFLTRLDKFIETDAAGNIIFRRDKVVRAADLQPPEVFKNGNNMVAVLHGRRLKCPAVFVEGLIALAVDLVADVVSTAQERAITEYDRRSCSILEPSWDPRLAQKRRSRL